MSKKLGLSAGRPSSSKAAALKAISETDEKLERVTVELSPELHLRLRTFCFKNKRTMSSVLRELVDKNIKTE
ncbi:plasmid partition protein ParG [Hydromonas duriensis]|uniref:ParG protein n=1 Tax=Hydromonas duriensis TaxID=1527608 RepID=A0A4R6Y6S6_9BURK|nr:plasmid partition protein ParG [Hydromonas duriensis]TDR27803.1 ParG protein [Hydromonas duriensis]